MSEQKFRICLVCHKREAEHPTWMDGTGQWTHDAEWADDFDVKINPNLRKFARPNKRKEKE